MRKSYAMLTAFAFVFLFFGSELYNMSSNATMMNTLQDKAEIDTGPELLEALAETAPRTPTDLRELVIALQEVTPLASRNDTDGDGIYDLVETVIGTDYQKNDTDFDGLTDMWEAMNGTDPLNPDSNDDGINDFEEVNVTLDLDNDGIPNAWDFDNDNDGVNDYSDLSPNARTNVSQSFNISVQTDGKPTYITFQLVPEDAEHLMIFYKTWNWPDGDEHGEMQDLDNSIDDIHIVPMLKLATDTFPDQSALDEMGVVRYQNVMMVELTPVLEYESIVAFTGRLLYLDTTPLDFEMKAELIWQVKGNTDVPVKRMQSGAGYLSVDMDGISAVGNIIDIADSAPFELVKWSRNTRATIKLLSGPYLSLSTIDNNTLVFNNTDPGPRETFATYWSGENVVLRSMYNLKYVIVNSTGHLVTVSSPNNYFFQFVDDTESTPVDLVFYQEDFALTGFSIEECFGTEVGIFYNATNTTEAWSANWGLEYLFLYNSTNTLVEMPSVLADQGVSVASQIISSRDRFQAAVNLSNSLIPTALSSSPPNLRIPVIIALEDSLKVLDLSDMTSGSYIAPEIFQANMTEGDLFGTKSLRTNWYNTTSYVGLSETEIGAEILTWGLEEEATKNLILMALKWKFGVNVVANIEGMDATFQTNTTLINVMQWILFSGLEIAGALPASFKMAAEWKRLGQVDEYLVKIVQYAAKKFDNFVEASAFLAKSSNWARGVNFVKAAKPLKYAKFFKALDKVLLVVGILVDIGIAIWSGFAIADQVGGDMGKELGTTYALVAAAVGVIMLLGLIVIAQVPVIGWLIALAVGIADAVGGFSSKITQFLTEMFFGTPLTMGYSSPSSYVKASPKVTIIDDEGDGLTVGDRIFVNGTLWTKTTAVVKKALENYWDYLSRFECAARLAGATRNDAWVEIVAPSGSNAATGSSEFQRFVVSRKDYMSARWPYTHVFETEYLYNAWIEPDIAQDDFPVIMRLEQGFTYWNLWKHYKQVLFWPHDCYHFDLEDYNRTSYDLAVFYYDVFPANLDEFLRWGTISSNDADGDELNATQEAMYGTDPTLYDTDGDSLSDSYELSRGYNPVSTDSDFDGVNDWYEHVYGTNVTNSDSDEDGLDDFTEISGWVISFNYMGNASLPFQIKVTSNPNSNNTEGDFLDDFEEYSSNTNPRSNDTNADGIPDLSYSWYSSEAIYEAATDWTLSAENEYVRDICVDDSGYLYASGRNETNDNIMIRKYDSSLSLVTLPSNSVFNDLTSFFDYTIAMEFGYSPDLITNRVFIALHLAGGGVEVHHFDLDSGNEDIANWEPGLVDMMRDFDFELYRGDYDLRAFTTNDWGIESVEVGGGAPMDMWGSIGPAVDQFDYPFTIAVDSKFGFVYLCDKQSSYGKPDRVVKIRLSDGNIIGVLDEYDSVLDVDVDDNGFVYVLGETSDGTSVQKFSPSGNEDTGFRFFGNGTHNFTASSGYFRRLTVGPDGAIYVLDWAVIGTPFTSRIWKFSQDFELASDMIPDLDGDWDLDGLTNAQEINGWDIVVKYETGVDTFTVTTDFLMSDTDFDGLDDYLEFTLGTNPQALDTDLDGVSDHEEWWRSEYEGEYPGPIAGTGVLRSLNMHPMYLAPTPMNLTNWDSDGDSLGDGLELSFGSSPVHADSDGEGLTDNLEFLLNSNPRHGDSDRDGLSDLMEYQLNSSLHHSDSDGDLALDGIEYLLGSNLTDGDSDSDSLADGFEYIIGSNPQSDDSDGDGAPDGLEVAMLLDIMDEDTDGDGISDWTELQWGSSPWATDSDWDGIPDGLDPDTFRDWEGPVVLVYEPDAANETLEFAAKLAEYVDVIVASLEEFLEFYTDYQYVVLVAHPNPSSYNVGRLVYDLLEGTGSVLDEMMLADSHEIAIRHGVWTSTQTVAILSSAYTYDVYTILQVLRGRDVTILPDYVLVDYDASAIIHSDNETHYAVFINSIDTLRNTDAVVLLTFDSLSTPSFSISRYNESTVLHVFNAETGLAQDQVALHNYIQLEMYSGQSALTSATVFMFYRHEDIDLVADGVLEGVGDIGENSLALYYYNDVSEMWELITTDQAWVISMGSNDTDLEIFGEVYAGYIWVQVTDFPMFTIAGQVIDWSAPAPPYMLIAGIVGGGLIAAVAIVMLRRWRRNRGFEKKMSLFDELLDSS